MTFRRHQSEVDTSIGLGRRGLLRGGVLASTLAPRLSRAGPAPDPSEALQRIPYLQPDALAKLPFGSHSHFLQPWRSYVETVPASRFLNGIGVVLNQGDETAPDTIAQLADHGFRTARIEISWGRLGFQDETKIAGDAALRQLLRTCKSHSLRPLILLNGHHGLPTPALQFGGTVLDDAPAGARTIRVATQGTIVPGFTGLSNLTQYWAAEALVTDLRGTQLSLSKPLPRAFRRGEPIQLASLKYRPFSRPGSEHAKATMAGWVRYVEIVSRYMVGALGSAGSTDKGFDLEAWNELTFGSNFLSMDNYVDPPADTTPPLVIREQIIAETAKWLSDHNAEFANVRLSNGFASTVPWVAASLQPSGVSALSKHPYPPLLEFPRDEQKGAALDRHGLPITWTPTYSCYFPEYLATGIQTETIMRDMGPAISDIYDVKHGCFARTGEAGPVPVWITEIGVNPREAGVTDADSCELLKAKATARTLLFYLNKGGERVYINCASGTSDDYGLVYERRAANSNIPRAIDVVRRIVKTMATDDPSDGPHRQAISCGFVVHAPKLSGLQFFGDNALSIPPIQNVDMLALLPYRANSRRVVIAYYFVTRDIRKSIEPESLTIEISGLPWEKASIDDYDPMSDRWSPVATRTLIDRSLAVHVLVTDSPRLLVLGPAKQPKHADRGTDLQRVSGRPISRRL